MNSIEKAALAAQRGSRFEQLRLYRHIETGHDFVGDQNAWHGAQRARDVDALRCPPESCVGNRIAASGGRPISFSSSRARAARCSRLAVPAASIG